jgi:CopA family copper-resistance protein
VKRGDAARPGVRPRISRRRFVEGVAAGGVVAALGGGGSRFSRAAAAELRGPAIDLAIGAHAVNVTGRTTAATLANGSLPGPILRWREGDDVVVRVRNALDRLTAIHWHGVLTPASMDGVPGLSFRGIEPGETFEYRFPARQSGTYWYHAHADFQEQTGVYGAIVIDPREPEPFAYDREHVVLLSDWTDRDPLDLYKLLKRHSDYFNYEQRTLGELVRDARRGGLRATVAERLEWGRMRMSPADLADVGGHAYTYLVNGQPPAANWTALFAPGERVRLRIVNGSSMSTFDVRIPGLAMTVVAADGLHVHPVTVEEFRIAAAEVLDVIVEPRGADAFTIFAQSLDRSGYARATLAVREGLAAPVPPLDPVVRLSMADMGHGEHAGAAPADEHAGHGAGAALPDAHAGHGAGAALPDAHVGHAASAAPSSAASEHAEHAAAATAQAHPASEARNPRVDMPSAPPSARLADPGVGLRGNGRRVLAYADLHSAFADPDGRVPERTIELHLTGHMERFLWSFDGVPFSGSEPIVLRYGERVRFVLVNDTMMEHPIHLHGMWSDLENEAGEFQLRKHTVSIPPGTRRSMRVTADALGRWAYHCHLLYHMEAGMFREVRVEDGAPGGQPGHAGHAEHTSAPEHRHE